MQPDIFHGAMINVDTNAGSFLVPADVFDPQEPLEGTEGSELYETEEVTGWFARLSSPGYLDRTDWIGPYGTEREAKVGLAEAYDICVDCGANLDHDQTACPECGSDEKALRA
jgi:ribosomal protein L40E